MKQKNSWETLNGEMWEKRMPRNSSPLRGWWGHTVYPYSKKQQGGKMSHSVCENHGKRGKNSNKKNGLAKIGTVQETCWIIQKESKCLGKGSQVIQNDSKFHKKKHAPPQSMDGRDSARQTRGQFLGRAK